MFIHNDNVQIKQVEVKKLLGLLILFIIVWDPLLSENNHNKYIGNYCLANFDVLV